MIHPYIQTLSGQIDILHLGPRFAPFEDICFLVPRPHLIKQLNDGWNRKLTIVCAPAGYGKTTLLSQWLDKNTNPIAWLTLDENDNDLAVFLNYFVVAVQRKFPNFGQATLNLLKAPQSPPLDQIAVYR